MPRRISILKRASRRARQAAAIAAVGSLALIAAPDDLAAQSRDIYIDDGTVSKVVLAPAQR